MNNPARRWLSPVRAAASKLLGRAPAAAPPPPPVAPPLLVFDPARRAPSHLFLALGMSNLCNYRCRHCHIWMNKESDSELTTAQRVDVIRQFAALSPSGAVIVPGGEVTMDPDELFTLTAACRAAGLACSINTNGSSVVDAAAARALLGCGLTHLTVSLDSHVPEIHRYTRGVATAYEDTLRAIRLLVEAKRETGAAVFVTVSCVLFDQNLRLLADYVAFCRSLGVDGADFQVLSRTFANAHPTRDVFFERHFFHTPEAKAEACALVTEVVRGSTDGFLQKRESDLDWLVSYITDPDFTSATPVCGSHERNLVVDPRGRVALCFNSRAVLPDAPFVGNVRERSLRELWTGGEAGDARRVMDACTLGCGTLNCHRR
jgi:MoaA/NifB/PqqE/SkfB family radical SAM enzyme